MRSARLLTRLVQLALGAAVIIAMIAGCEPGNNNPGGGDKFAMYTLTTGVTPANSGTVDRDPYTTTYQNGTEVTLTAKPAAGYRFTGWSDTSMLKMATQKIIMKRNTALTAIFEQIPEDRYTLLIDAKDGGTVSRNPDSTSYAPGTLVKVWAKPDDGYRFARWSGASTDTTDTITVTMNANLALTANFEQSRFPLRVLIDPVDGGTIQRNDPDTTTYEVGTKVTVRMIMANTGFTFIGWSGAATSTDTTVTVTISKEQPQILTANFQLISVNHYTLTVERNTAAGGTVARNPSLTNYPAGKEVIVTASPAAGYKFIGWTGDLMSDSTEVTVTMNTNLTLTANFEAIMYTLTVNQNLAKGGTVALSPGGGSYPAGTTVTATAKPGAGYIFTGWTGEPTSTETGVTVTMNGNQTLTANFQPGFIDPRDGKAYRTVEINGWTWMAENLNYVIPSKSLCYDNVASNCAKYGRLYNWDAATTACPEGWHLPSRVERDSLVQAAGGFSVAGRNLKSTTDWNYHSSGSGTDSLGFSALPGGIYLYYDGNFSYLGTDGHWWSATATNESNAYHLEIYYDKESVNGGGGLGFGVTGKLNGLSVRCVQYSSF